MRAFLSSSTYVCRRRHRVVPTGGPSIEDGEDSTQPLLPDDVQWSPSALTPGLWLHTCQAADQVASDSRVSAKIVPAVTETSARHSAQRRLRPLQSATPSRRREVHPSQRNPSTSYGDEAHETARPSGDPTADRVFAGLRTGGDWR